MGENDKPFACTNEGCQMTFTNEDHLNVHRKKHDMVLNLGLTCKSTVTADQTPTPTRFIRNCEEVGLFQDLQNVNPFEETFRKAIEHSKSGIAHMPDLPNDDSLHTPQILHHISESSAHNTSQSPDKHFNDVIHEDILRIDSHDSLSKDDCLSPIANCVEIKDSNFSYSTELSTSNEREYELSSSTSNDTTVEDLSIVKKNLNSYLLRSNFLHKHNTKSDVKEKIKEVLHNKRRSDIKPLDLKIKDNTSSSTTKKPRQRINLKSKLKSIVGAESEVIKIDYKKNVNLYDKNINEVEKRRAMNRMAQMRSRKRKKMWLDQMEQEIEKLKMDNKLILMENQKLKEENILLKSMLLKHNNCSLSVDENTMCPNHPFVLALFTIVSLCTHTAINAANIPIPATSAPEVESDVRVDCNNDEIVVSINTKSGRFNGMIYPAGLTKNSPCFGEWVHTAVPVKYKLPLRACNTMSVELDDGGIEYFNTIVVQPHLKLVTNQGRSFHIRCRYSTRNNTVIINDSNGPKLDYLHSEDTSIAPMPGCTMKIFSGDPSNKEVAESVKIGDPLSLQVSLDEQDIYGIRVTDCLVKDGIGSGEQKLIGDDGCPLDPEIMGLFQYSDDKTNAIVKFQAHKFPSTESVYYQCNVKLCLKADGGCAESTSATCGSNRIRRQANNADTSEGTPATIEVYSGLYVNEANDPAKVDDDSVFSEKAPEDSICISQKNFAIGICVAGLILMLCAITAILCLLARRRTKKVSSNPSSSIYSGPYTNTAYSHSS